MTFLQPALLIALPLAALPVIIHLIHLYRRRQVKWAAMMFLRMAQKMNKGLSRLRQVLILTLRVLAVAAVIFVITRPLAGGWLGLTGGPPDTVMVLLDRSASMEQVNPGKGVSKRAAGLRNVAKAINDAVGTRSRLVLIDSATRQPQAMARAEALLDLPQTRPTETAADMPALLQSALDYISTNKTGRTDVWLLTDLQQTDWDAGGSRWGPLRAAFATLQGVRFHLLSYPQAPQEDLAVSIARVTRRETSDRAQLLFDLRVTRHAGSPQAAEVPLRVVINGAATIAKVSLKDSELVLHAHAVPIDKSAKRGWGRIELPADACAANNVFHFVFDEAPVLRSAIVSDDEAESRPLAAALAAAAGPAHPNATTVVSHKRAAEIAWDETALVIWHAPIPDADDVLARQLQNHAAAGRSLLFLPAEAPDANALFGLRWGQWELGTPDKPKGPEWWRNDSDLLAHTRDGAALPVGTLEITRHRAIAGEGIPLARLADQTPLLVRSATQRNSAVYFLGALPGPASSSLARDGVVMFAMLQRALDAGARTLGNAQQRFAAAGALGADPSKWQALDHRLEAPLSHELPLRAGVVGAGSQLAALNRPPGEDLPQTLSTTALHELFAGLDFRVLADDLDSGRSLTNEVWRTFLIVMALALFGEALLCMPQRRSLPAPLPS